MFFRSISLSILGLTVVFSDALAVSKLALAQIPPQQINVPNSSQPPNQPLFIRELGLTSEQVEKIETINRQSSKEILKTKEELDQAEEELETLLSSSNATGNQLQDKFNRVEQLRQKLSKLTFESRVATRAVLTPEQRAAFEQTMQKLREARSRRTAQ